MAADNPVRRWFVNGSTTLLLVPVFWWCVGSEEMGLAGCFREPDRLTPSVIAIAAGYLASILLLLKWGALRWALGLFLVSGYFHLVTVGNAPQKRGEAVLELGNTSQITGVDVYCNGEYLGRTPLEIKESEFRARVPPWTVPPRQRHVKPFIPPTPGKIDLRSAGFALVPIDPFDNGRRSGGPAWDETWPRLPSVGYWWRFEKQGCQALTTIENFGGGKMNRRLHVTPQITFPSIHRQWQLLLEDLHEHEFAAGQEWFDYVLNWSELLWPEVQAAATDDERLSPVLRELVRRKWNLSADPTADECHQVLGAILELISQDRAFRYPSFESEGLLEVARKHPELIVEAYQPEPLKYRSGGWHSGGGHGWNYLAGDAVALRRYAIEYAISFVTPYDLLERMRIQQALLQDEYYSRILANYRRAGFAHAVPAVPLKNPPAEQVAFDNAIDFYVTVDNPALDDSAYTELGAGSGNFFQGDRLVRSRRGRSPESLDKLADWIAMKTSSSEDYRALLLAHIHAPRTRAAYAAIAPRVTLPGRLQVAELLNKRPNPFADVFLTETWEMLRKNESHTVYSWVAQAILACDTPHTRTWMLRKLAEDDREWSDFAGCATAPLPALRWLLPTASQLTSESARVHILRPLAAMESPEAWSLIEAWSHESSEWVATQARLQLAERDKLEAERAERKRQIAELLAGRIQPDELLPAPTPYIWSDQGYVPEVELGQ